MAFRAASSQFVAPTALRGEHRFFFVATWLLAFLTVSGFAFHLLAGISRFGVPLIFHVHAFVFMGFIGLYLAQVTLAARGHVAWHMQLGRVAAIWIPLILVFGSWLTIAALRVTGGPPIFGQSEFLLVNLCHLAGFGGLAIAALSMRAKPDWHKRLMFGAITTVSMPGISRLVPPTLTLPHAYPKLFLLVALFPLAGMMMDRRVHGRIHAAWWWALLVPLAAMLVGEALYASGLASGWVADFVAGTPGGKRPPGAFLPPGLAM